MTNPVQQEPEDNQEKEGKMNISQRIKLFAISTLLIVGLAACNKPGPAETAGKKIDQSTQKAGEAIDDAAAKAKEKMEKK